MALNLRNAVLALGFMALGASTTLAFDAAAGVGPEDGDPADHMGRGGPRGMGGHHGPGSHLLRAMAELELTDVQRGALERVKREIREDKLAAHEDGRSERERMADMIISGKVDRKELHSIIDRVAAQRLGAASGEA